MLSITTQTQTINSETYVAAEEEREEAWAVLLKAGAKQLWPDSVRARETGWERLVSFLPSKCLDTQKGVQTCLWLFLLKAPLHIKCHWLYGFVCIIFELDVYYSTFVNIHSHFL